MKKRLGYLASTFAAVALAVFALVACSSSDSPTGPNSFGLATPESAGSTKPTSAGSSETTALESSESTEPTSAESTTPESAETTTPGTSETTTPESSESETPESSESTTPESSETTTFSASTLTPLLDYELTQPFIDEGWRDECLRLLNEYRATEDLEPMTLADAEKQQCAIDQAAADMADNAAHGHFGDCGESAQNSGPNFSTSWRSNATAAVQYYEMAMWENEKAKVEQGITDYQQIGHYLNMKDSYSKVACGIAISADGKTGWFNMNFYY